MPATIDCHRSVDVTSTLADAKRAAGAMSSAEIIDRKPIFDENHQDTGRDVVTIVGIVTRDPGGPSP